MNKLFIIVSTAVLILCACTQQTPVPGEGDGTVSSTFDGSVDYDAYFTSERLRLDFVLAGNNQEQYAFLSELHRENEWAGSPNALIDKFGYGQYFMEAFSGDELILILQGESTIGCTEYYGYH